MQSRISSNHRISFPQYSSHQLPLPTYQQSDTMVARSLCLSFPVTNTSFLLNISIHQNKYLSISYVGLFSYFFVFLSPSKFQPWGGYAPLLNPKLLLKLLCHTESHLLQRKNDAIPTGDEAATAIYYLPLYYTM